MGDRLGALNRLRGAVPPCLAVLLLVGAAVFAPRAARAGERDEADDLATRFAGAAACKPCHEAAYERWAASNHAHTSKRALAAFLPEDVVRSRTVRHPPNATTWRGQDRYGYMAETVGADGELARFRLALVVGRARIRMFVATMPDGRYQVLPAMLEAPTNEWFDYSHLIFGGPGATWDTPPVIRPGEASFWTGPVRSWGLRCANCHASGWRARDLGPDGQGPRASWRDTGVDCEACHGPGRSHVEAWNRKEAGAPLPPIDRLSTDAANEVCLICHMEHEIVRPGYQVEANLFEHIDPTLLVDPERADPTGRPTELIYEGLSFLSSRCATQGALRCVTCHEPHGSGKHGMLRFPKPLDDFCYRCHETIGAEPKAHTHHEPLGPGARCIACHMPKLPVERGHGVVTDHTIGIPRPGLRADRMARDACRWCHDSGSWDAPEGSPHLDAEGIRRAFELWWPQAAEPEPWVQAIALARLGEEGAGARLLKVVGNRRLPRVVRASAARLLDRDPAVRLGPLLDACRDRDSLVRRSAVRALQARTGPEVDAALLRALSDESAAVRGAAARAALAGWSRVQTNAPLLEALIPVLQAEAAALPCDDMRWFRLGAAREIGGDKQGAIDAYARQVALDSTAANIRAHLERLRR